MTKLTDFTDDFLITSDIDVESPEMTAPTDPPTETPATGAPTASPTGTPVTPTDAPVTPTDVPVTPTDAPVTPTDAPTFVSGRITSAPSDSPREPCESTDGIFGVVSGTPSTDVAINYMYEMETAPGVSQMTIDTVILPQLEKAIVDSVLEEVFPNECAGVSVGKRRLRIQGGRRLTVTGITMNPPDMVNEECTSNYDDLFVSM
jgi:hypothetical protein